MQGKQIPKILTSWDIVLTSYYFQPMAISDSKSAKTGNIDQNSNDPATNPLAGIKKQKNESEQGK